MTGISRMDLNSEGQPDLTLVVPVYGNAATLNKLQSSLQEVLRSEDITYELLFVNDAGPDHSLKILLDMLNQHAEIVVVNLHYNIGQHAAVLHGLRFARGRYCLIMDADLQDPVESILVLMRQSFHFQAVFAGRRGQYQGRLRMMSSYCYKRLLHSLTGLPVDAGIFVLMERQLVETLLKMPVRIPWINVMVGLSGLSMCSIPVKRNTRIEGKSAYSSWGRIRSALRGIYCVLTYRYWQPKKPYLETLKSDPVKWVRRSKAL